MLKTAKDHQVPTLQHRGSLSRLGEGTGTVGPSPRAQGSWKGLVSANVFSHFTASFLC